MNKSWLRPLKIAPGLNNILWWIGVILLYCFLFSLINTYHLALRMKIRCVLYLIKYGNTYPLALRKIIGCTLHLIKYGNTYYLAIRLFLNLESSENQIDSHLLNFTFLDTSSLIDQTFFWEGNIILLWKCYG